MSETMALVFGRLCRLTDDPDIDLSWLKTVEFISVDKIRPPCRYIRMMMENLEN